MARTLVLLRRRGVVHGRFAPPRRAILATDERRERWKDARPIPLPGALRATLREHARAIAATLGLFSRLRRGASFQDEARARLARQRLFRPAGASVDADDRREIEKVFADARRRGRPVARELSAKLSWIAEDPQDGSLRIRFSFGSEKLRDWQPVSYTHLTLPTILRV